MARSKAEFRAIREMTGLTQAGLASELGVEVRSVKRWESPEAPQVPPADAWAILDAAKARQDEIVAFSLAKVVELEDELGEEPAEVRLPYWASADDYGAHSTDAAAGVAGDWRMANANNRRLAAALMATGRIVEWQDGSANPARPR